MNNRGQQSYHGAAYDRHVIDRNEQSTTHKLKSAYWTTKQAVIKKFGRKEDEYIVASDNELDAKLELFKSVQKTTTELWRVIDRYQDRLCALSQAENEMGRFLKSRSTHDKTQASKMMSAVGKSLSFSAQQRLALRNPLTRLQQEVSTFRSRAISDTGTTVHSMEMCRTEYRGALLWMKNVSEELDPDTYKRLEKFRKVQNEVRLSKNKFDRYKVDTMQKIDLLAASRCNMFSHVLSIYQDNLLQFWEKTARIMAAVAESFKGYQYFEFSLLKSLTEESKKLAELTNDDDTHTKAVDDINKMLDEIIQGNYKEEYFSKLMSPTKGEEEDCLAEKGTAGDEKKYDLLNIEYNNNEEEEEENDTFLNDLFSTSSSNFKNVVNTDATLKNEKSQFISGNLEWNELFGEEDEDQLNLKKTEATTDLQSDFGIDWFGGAATADFTLEANSSKQPPSPPPSYSLHLQHTKAAAAATNEAASTPIMSKNTEMSKWVNLFADLDPLANPDQISKNEGQIMEM